MGRGEWGGDGWNPDSERAGGRWWSKDEKNFIGKMGKGKNGQQMAQEGTYFRGT